MRCRYSSASDGFRLLVPGERAVICSAKPLRSYLLADFIKRYINKRILLLLLSATLLKIMIQITQTQVLAKNDKGDIIMF